MSATTKHNIGIYQESNGILEGVGTYEFLGDLADLEERLTTGEEVAEWDTETRDGREYIVITAKDEYEGGTFWYEIPA